MSNAKCPVESPFYPGQDEPKSKLFDRLTEAQRHVAVEFIRHGVRDGQLDGAIADGLLSCFDGSGDILPTTPPPPPPPDAWARLTEEQRESVRAVLLNASRVSTISPSELAAAFERLGLR